VECRNKSDISKTGATETISKSFRKYMSNVPGQHDIKDLQQTAIICTTHMLQKIIMETYITFNTGYNITSNTYCTHGTDATPYAPESGFYFRHIIVNSLHKRDK
jgi:hypothetical protein